jgi:hypothetical protein
MKIDFSRMISFMFLGASLSMSTAWADISLPIVNPSFETLPSGGLTLHGGCGSVSGCAYDFGQIPGWHVSDPSDTGQWQPGTTGSPPDFFSSLPNGPTIAFSNGGTIYQQVGTVSASEVGQTLILSVYVGDRSDGASVSSYLGTVDLMVGGVSYFATGLTPVSGSWSLWTVSVNLVSANLNQGITVMLLNPKGIAQVDFDGVSLELAPEPGFYGVLALGLAGLLFAVTRRRSIKQVPAGADRD